MKKIFILNILTLLVAGITSAQVTINPRVKTFNGYSDDDAPKTTTCVINNTSDNSADSMIKWTIITFDIPSAWTFDFCDPQDCITNLHLGSTSTFKLKKGSAGPLKSDFYTNNTNGVGRIQLKLEYENGARAGDTLTLTLNSWMTGVNNAKKQNEVAFFPNPAKDLITLKYNTSKPVEVEIFNILGNKVKTFTHNGGETAVNIGELQKGMYFMRFNDNGVSVSKSFTKSE